MMRETTEGFRQSLGFKILVILAAALIIGGGVFALFGGAASAAVVYADAQSGVYATDPLTGFAGGDGSESSPYLIATAAQLDNVRNVDAYTDMLYFRMVADIDLADYLAEGGDGYKQDGWGEAGWKSITTVDENGSKRVFRGTFDGGGYEIKNLWINSSGDDLYVGLFDAVAGVFFDLKIVLDPEKGIAGGSFTGALAGTASDADLADVSLGAAIKGCSVTGQLTTENNDMYMNYCGGLLGEAKFLTIEECYFQGEISGVFEDESRGDMRGMGGIAGLSNGAVYRNCYSILQLNISGGITETDFAGGLVGGYKGAEKLENCYSVIADQGGLKPFAGAESGYFGWGNPPTCTTTGCYYVGAASESGDEDGAIRLEGDDRFRESSYMIDAENSWGFSTVWGIREGAGMPYLKVFKNAVLLTPVSDNDIYDADNKTPNNVSFSGDYYEDKPITVTGITAPDTAMKNAGEYPVAVAYKTAHAYQVSVAKYSIQKATVTVTTAPMSRNVYAGLPEVKYLFSGFVGGDGEAAISGLETLTPATDTAQQRGTYEVTVTGNLSADNYTFRYLAGEIEVTGLYYGEIAGIAAAGAVLLAVAAFALVWFGIKKKTFADLGAGIKGVFVKTNTVTLTETVYVEKPAQPFPDSFSKKEREIAIDLLSGMPRHEIAEKHFISHNTLLSHIKKIYSKAGCQSQVEFITKYGVEG